MSRGTVVEWDGKAGVIRERASADGVRFATESLHILLPGDVRVGLDVDFDRIDEVRG